MYTCPICGYKGLNELPYDEFGEPSYEICPSCGFEYGFDDLSEGISFEEYRKKWILEGSKWFWKKSKPKNWTLTKQLENINLKLEDIIK